MTTTRLQTHGHALVLASRCPACAELLHHKVLWRGLPCEQCGTALSSWSMDAQEVSRRMRRRGLVHLAAIAGAVALGHFAVGWFPLLSSLLMLAAAAWIRFGILYPMTRGMSPKRRTVTRWTARLLVGIFLALSLIFTEALTLVPVLGVIAKSVLGVIQVASIAGIVTLYVRWQLERSVAGDEPAAWEWGLLIAVAGTLLLSVCVFVFALFWVLEQAGALMEFLGDPVMEAP